MNEKLNQIIAIEKGVKSRVYSNITELNKIAQKAGMFNGFHKTYIPKDEDGDQYPPESIKVQAQSDSIIRLFFQSLTELLDVVATKDVTNCEAKADIIVDGTTLLSDIPSTYLLFLEKQMNDIRTFINNIPVLDENEDWIKDENSNLYKTSSIKTNKTKKLQKPIVLYDATDRHPAQTQLITEDIVIGSWETIKISGAISKFEKDKINLNLNKLSDSIKKAREAANMTVAKQQYVGSIITKYLFG